MITKIDVNRNEVFGVSMSIIIVKAYSILCKLESSDPSHFSPGEYFSQTKLLDHHMSNTCRVRFSLYEPVEVVCEIELNQVCYVWACAHKWSDDFEESVLWGVKVGRVMWEG